MVLMIGLASADLERLGKYEAAWGERDPRGALVDQARREFGGRGVEVAEHFLKHTDARPRNDAYFFVLRAVADAETAFLLIRALPNPPARQSGILDRDFGEVDVAIEAVLDDETVRSDPRIVAALEQAIATERAKPPVVGVREIAVAV